MPPEGAKAPDAAAAGFPASSLSSSGNLLADRRFAYACAALAVGDLDAAMDLFEQTLELAPHWAPAWMRLGEARQKAGAPAGALQAYAEAMQHDATGVLGARLKLASLGHVPPPATAPPAYVQGLFDQYAPRFDDHLVRTLEYRGPEELLNALIDVCGRRGREAQFEVVYDLGCGTGLMAKALSGRSGSVAGVDLAPRMIEAARRTGFYNHLEIGECAAFLRGRDARSCDLVIAADVFVYMGDLAAVFEQAARVLDAHGLFAFSAQVPPAGANLEFSVGEDMRFAHSPAYLERLAAANDFQVETLQSTVLRKDRGAGVPALLVILSRL